VLSHHARAGSLAVIDGAVFTEPKTRVAEGFLAEWSAPVPLVVIASPEETAIAKSFRNLPRVVPVEPSELEVGTLVWARSVLVTEAALPSVVELAR
jgi:ribosomal protein L4